VTRSALQFNQLGAFRLHHFLIIAGLEEGQLVWDVEIRFVACELPVLLVHHDFVCLIFIFLELCVLINCWHLKTTESRVLQVDSFLNWLNFSSFSCTRQRLFAVDSVALLQVLELHDCIHVSSA